MLLSSPKIHPSSKNGDDPTRDEPAPTLSYKSKLRDSKSLRMITAVSGMKSGISFVSQSSAGELSSQSVESLINFLTTNADQILKDRELLHKFEELSGEALSATHDAELHRIVKSHGWTGSRYRNADEVPLEAQSLLQALSNLYLRNKVNSYTNKISNLFGLGDEKGADQILSFCPDLLLTCLKETCNTQNHYSSSDPVRCFTFTGACMLADISGFSKFSAAMCLKGVSGLDDLREATNGFLGHIVKIVYEHHGDVIAFAGDALICVFLDDNPNHVEDELNNSIFADPHHISNQNMDACIRALECACILSAYHTKQLSAHLGVSYGEMKLALLGGLNDQWVYLLNGECVVQLASCINDAASKEVAASEACYQRALMALQKLKDSMPVQEEEEGGFESESESSSVHSGENSDEEDRSESERYEDREEEMKQQQLKLESADNQDADNNPSSSMHLGLTISTKKKKREKPLMKHRPCGESGNYLIDAIYNPMRRFDMAVLAGSHSMSSIATSPSHAIRTTVSLVASAMASVPSPPGKLLGRKMSLLMRRQSARTFDVNSLHIEQQELLRSAALFVPRPVLAAVNSESLEHIGELRQVTTMFLSLDSYSPIKHRDPCTLQPFFLAAQKALFESGGFLRQFLIDDKGCVFIAMWGMPSFTYANNCSRALFCAVSIAMQALDLDHYCSIGITTGNIFCGSVGAPERRDYAGIGNDVNLAARLMSKAHGRVLIDKNTYSNLNQATKALLSEAEEMKLKGIENPVRPFQYDSDIVPRIAAVDESPGFSMILRRQVKAILSTQMDRVTNSSTVIEQRDTYFTVILGMPGTGKSTAAEYFRHGLRKRNIPVVLIQARPGHEGVPYGLMRELFLDLVGEDNFSTEDQQQSKVQELIELAYPTGNKEERLRARLSLEIVLGVDWHDLNYYRSLNITLNSTNSGTASDNNGSDNNNSSSPFVANDVPNMNVRSSGKHANSGNDTMTPIHTTSNNARHAYLERDREMLDNYETSMNRPVGDMTFYKILAVLLRGQRTAIIVEDAHFCDELSWNELYLMLLGNELNVVVLLTMRSSSLKNLKDGNNPNVSQVPNSAHYESLNSATEANSNSIGDNKPVRRTSMLMSHIDPTSFSAHITNSNVDADAVGRYGLRAQTSPAYLSILGHEHSTIVEMNSLSESEVRDILTQTLKVTDISVDLVRLVLDVSSGNAFWCKAIANFINERGIKELEKATTEGDSPQSSLKHLIILRMEKLSMDDQLVLKHASIIGDEFSENMLQAVLPEKLKPQLSECLESLVEHGFILCIEEFPQLIFAFQNQLIRFTVYELTPPRDAAHIHLAAAEFIERVYAKNLRPFYPSLAHHYQNSPGKRALTFKYKVKAADIAISRGAYTDGLRFAQSSSKFAVSKEELRVLLLVISRALRDINSSIEIHAHGRRRSLSFSTTTDMEQQARIASYIQLKLTTEASLEKLTKGVVTPGEVTPGNKNRLVIKKQPSARLTWQPSYVASKLNEDNSDDDDDDEEEEVKKKGMCVIS